MDGVDKGRSTEEKFDRGLENLKNRWMLGDKKIIIGCSKSKALDSIGIDRLVFLSIGIAIGIQIKSNPRAIGEHRRKYAHIPDITISELSESDYSVGTRIKILICDRIRFIKQTRLL